MYKSSDNLHYEKIGDGEPVCIEEQLPFEIPDSWEWVRLANVGDWGSGATPSRTHPEYYGGDIPWLKTGDLNDDYIVHIPESITKVALEKTSVRLNPKDSVLIAMYGATIGKLGILTYPATTNQACCACLPIKGVYNKFLFYFLMSHKTAFIKRGEGGAQPNISKEKIIATLMPLPPLTEQHRIVAQIEQILPHINEYELTESKIEQLNTVFPEKLKKSILQEAVQGKLVPQDPSDEPASVLLDRIRDEKARLIKDGKIKKDKNESVIFRRDNSYYEKVGDNEPVLISDKFPFDIPDSWCWTRFKNIIIDDKGGGTPDKSNSKYWGGTIPWMSVKDFSRAKNGIIIDTVDHITQEGVNGSSTNVINTQAIILCTRMGLGKYAKLSKSTAINQDLRAIWLTPYISEKYFLYFYKTLNIAGRGVTVKGIKREALLETLIPIPPIQEQNRIIDKIDSMIELCNKL